MEKYLLRILWISELGCLIVGYIILLKVYAPSPLVYGVFLVLFFWGLLSWLYITLRIFPFSRKLIQFVKKLLAGNYEVGLEKSYPLEDEVAGLERLVNDLAERLRAYNRLCMDKVGFNYRALDLIYRTVSQGVIIADLENRIFRLNPVVRSLFEVEQASITFDSIEKQEENKPFMELLKDVVERQKVQKEGAVTLQLPVRRTKRNLLVIITPLKDKREMVRLAIIFIRGVG
ncbi:MAG: hypothetical protein ACMUIA_06165 [bacterium]